MRPKKTIVRIVAPLGTIGWDYDVGLPGFFVTETIKGQWQTRSSARRAAKRFADAYLKPGTFIIETGD